MATAKIAFYAPLKAPDFPRPSGDRTIARLYIEALSRAGYRVVLASRLRSFDPQGSRQKQEVLAKQGRKMAERLIRYYRMKTPEDRPSLWVTYHLYYKAPDWIGPEVAKTLGIPYIVAEASRTPKRALEVWAAAHRAVETSLRQAAVILTPTARDYDGLRDLPQTILFPPFLDSKPWAAAALKRQELRRTFAKRYELDENQPWLLAIAMMRHKAKSDSYRFLAEALAFLQHKSWTLITLGSGPAEHEVKAAFSIFPANRLRFIGQTDRPATEAWAASCDILTWPGLGEAFGMCYLEAQAAGCPVIACRSPGVETVLQENHGALLTTARPEAYAKTLARWLDNPIERRKAGALAVKAVARRHDLDSAADRLARIVNRVLDGYNKSV